MGRKRAGIFNKIGEGKPGTIKARASLIAARQFSHMSQRLIFKAIHQAQVMIYKGRPIEADDEIQTRLRLAFQSAVETTELISWCCDAAGIETEEGKEAG